MERWFYQRVPGWLLALYLAIRNFLVNTAAVRAWRNLREPPRFWQCANGCDSEMVVICGGADPWFLHGATEEEALRSGNIYFYARLHDDRADFDYVREPNMEVPFTLTDDDWAAMESHADGGCCSEPQCAECLELMDRIEGVYRPAA